MISGIEKFYCKSRLHARIWRYIADIIFPEFLPFFPPSPFILEIGTGQGLGAIFLARKLEGSRFICIDNEHDMVRSGIRNVKREGLQDRIKVEWGDASALDFPENSFDAAVAITVLHHVPDYEKAILEVARVLKPGGIFMIVDFDFKASIFPRFDILIGSASSTFSWREMEEALKKAGLATLKVEFHSIGMFVSVSSKRKL